MTNKKISMVASPAALVLWPKLNEPNTRFNEAGEYEATLVFDPKNNDHQKFLDNLERMYEEAVASMAEEHKKPKIKRADSPIRPLLDKDDNETGMMKVKFKLTASGETKDGRKFERRPVIYNISGQPYDGVVGHNSEVRVAFKPSAYFVPSVGAGLSLRLEAVQVLKANQGRSFTDYGFEAQAEEAAAADTKGDQSEEF